jgi:hypothetical protein
MPWLLVPILYAASVSIVVHPQNAGDRDERYRRADAAEPLLQPGDSVVGLFVGVLALASLVLDPHERVPQVLGPVPVVEGAYGLLVRDDGNHPAEPETVPRERLNRPGMDYKVATEELRVLPEELNGHSEEQKVDPEELSGPGKEQKVDPEEHNGPGKEHKVDPEELNVAGTAHPGHPARGHVQLFSSSRTTSHGCPASRQVLEGTVSDATC